jgi:hypothetical protein
MSNDRRQQRDGSSAWRRWRSLSAAVGLVLALPSAAGAQDPPAAVPTPAPTAAPAPPPAAVQQMTVAAERVGRRATVLAGDGIRVRVVVAPFLEGERVIVRAHRNGRKILARSRPLKRSKTGASGQAVITVRSRLAGRLLLSAEHPASPALAAAATARPAAVSVLPRLLAPGARGRGVRMVQDRLKALGYVIGTRGSFDARTQRAILAYRKNLGLARTASADAPVLRLLARGRGHFPVRHRDHGRHVEADLSKQLLVLIGAGGRTERIYPISSGAPGTPTVLGHFRVYRRTPGINAIGMIDSSYFHRGYAIHGYRSVPIYPASHGCLRVPPADARAVYDWIRMGTRVDVYS